MLIIYTFVYQKKQSQQTRKKISPRRCRMLPCWLCSGLVHVACRRSCHAMWYTTLMGIRMSAQFKHFLCSWKRERYLTCDHDGGVYDGMRSCDDHENQTTFSLFYLGWLYNRKLEHDTGEREREKNVWWSLWQFYFFKCFILTGDLVEIVYFFECVLKSSF